MNAGWDIEQKKFPYVFKKVLSGETSLKYKMSFEKKTSRANRTFACAEQDAQVSNPAQEVLIGFDPAQQHDQDRRGPGEAYEMKQPVPLYLSDR